MKEQEICRAYINSILGTRIEKFEVCCRESEVNMAKLLNRTADMVALHEIKYAAKRVVKAKNQLLDAIASIMQLKELIKFTKLNSEGLNE